MNLVKISLVEVVIAGVGAGLWPLVMQKSGLGGSAIALVCGICSFFAALCLFGMNGLQGVALASVKCLPAVAGGLMGALALLLLSDVAHKSSPKELATLYVVMLVVQIAMPVLYILLSHGHITFKQGVGLAAAVVAALLLA